MSSKKNKNLSTSSKTQKKGILVSKKSSFKSVTKNEGSVFIPAFKINNNGGNPVIEFNLNKDQEIGVTKHSLAYVDSHVKINTRTDNGFFTGLMRKITTGNNIYKSFYKGTDDNNNKLSISGFMPSSDILCIKVLPGEAYKLSNESILAYTSNLKLKNSAQFKNIFVQEGLFQLVYYNDTPDAGMLFLTCYGGYQILNIKSGEKKKVAHGLFLASDATLNYNVSTLGDTKSFFVGTTGTLLEFEGPCTVYLNNKNMTYLINKIYTDIKSHMQSEKMSHKF